MQTAHLEPHRRAIFGLCYRMTGDAADAEDLVQDTFRRALEKPPPDLERSLRPWLLRVATNLAIDTLRRRQSERYFGPWLPSPVPTDRLALDEEPGPEARYAQLESVSVAFLLALQALEPRPRAVLLMSDVLGYRAREVGEALELSEGNVRVILHRARKALAAYDASRDEQPTREQHQEALGKLLQALATRDMDALESLFTEDVRWVTDAGGEFVAGVRPLRGLAEIVRFLVSVERERPYPTIAGVHEANGRPMIELRWPEPNRRYAPRGVLHIEVTPDGRIRELHTVLATRKLGLLLPA